MFIQLTGLSGAGKTSIAKNVKLWMHVHKQLMLEVIDADEYRKTVCSDLGFSKEDRCENIRRLGKIAEEFAANKRIVIIAAINPYATIRAELKERYDAKTVWINCNIEQLVKRDTKGLYQRTLLPDGDSRKIYNLTGINDPYEAPADADLILNTAMDNLATSTQKLYDFILQGL
jgi:adenylylsulfate kinase